LKKGGWRTVRGRGGIKEGRTIGKRGWKNGHGLDDRRREDGRMDMGWTIGEGRMEEWTRVGRWEKGGWKNGHGLDDRRKEDGRMDM
jgi:hypothetical protein